MVRFLLQRLLLAAGVCLTVSLLAFVLLNASGDVAASIAGEEATPQRIAEIRESLGLNAPWFVRYGQWVLGVVRGDLGTSLFFHEPVTRLIAQHLPKTLMLASLSLLFMVVVSVVLGICSAVWSNRWVDRLALTIAVIGQAMPTFWFGLILIVVFSLTLGWVPASGSETLVHYVLPAVALGYYSTPPMMRLIRTNMIDALASDYIRTARAKGMRPWKIVFKHALRNAAIPVVALLTVQFGNMLGGSVVIETVFNVQGLGFLAWESITRMDIPVVQAVLLIVAMFYVVMVLLSDVINAWLDPRIRIQ